LLLSSQEPVTGSYPEVDAWVNCKMEYSVEECLYNTFIKPLLCCKCSWKYCFTVLWKTAVEKFCTRCTVLDKMVTWKLHVL